MRTDDRFARATARDRHDMAIIIDADHPALPRAEQNATSLPIPTRAELRRMRPDL